MMVDEVTPRFNQSLVVWRSEWKMECIWTRLFTRPCILIVWLQVRPAYGFFLRNSIGTTFRDVVIGFEKPDNRP
jgi:hypothetical protein